MSRPACHNRKPFTDPNAGWKRMQWDICSPDASGVLTWKPVYRYRWPWFATRCATWQGVGIGQPTDAYPTGTPYPIAHGFDCTGCRWLPEGVSHVV